MLLVWSSTLQRVTDYKNDVVYIECIYIFMLDKTLFYGMHLKMEGDFEKI